MLTCVDSVGLFSLPLVRNPCPVLLYIKTCLSSSTFLGATSSQIMTGKLNINYESTALA